MKERKHHEKHLEIPTEKIKTLSFRAKGFLLQPYAWDATMEKLRKELISRGLPMELGDAIQTREIPDSERPDVSTGR